MRSRAKQFKLIDRMKMKQSGIEKGMFVPYPVGTKVRFYVILISRKYLHLDKRGKYNITESCLICTVSGFSCNGKSPQCQKSEPGLETISCRASCPSGHKLLGTCKARFPLEQGRVSRGVTWIVELDCRSCWADGHRSLAHVNSIDRKEFNSTSL